MPDVMRTFNNVIDENIGNVGEKLNSLNNLDKLFTAFTSASTTLNAIDTSIGNVSAKLNDLVQLETQGLTVQIANLPRVGIFNADELTEGAFSCIRALAQVQDLVTDKSWFEEQVANTTVTKTAKTNDPVKDNNATLIELRKHKSYSECEQLLEKNQDLLDRFKLQFTTPFKDGKIKELGERLLQIQALNSELVSHFAKHKP